MIMSSRSWIFEKILDTWIGFSPGSFLTFYSSINNIKWVDFRNSQKRSGWLLRSFKISSFPEPIFSSSWLNEVRRLTPVGVYLPSDAQTPVRFMKHIMQGKRLVISPDVSSFCTSRLTLDQLSSLRITWKSSMRRSVLSTTSFDCTSQTTTETTAHREPSSGEYTSLCTEMKLTRY